MREKQRLMSLGIAPDVKLLSESLGVSEKAVIDNMWFQQYKKNDKHSWHTHGLSNFSNVYFVELPLKSLATEILNVNNLNLKEGDLLTFPSHLYHRSPINKTNKRKTIISFNCDFVNYMDYSKI
jgi:ectoine hydroxylase-related dioxygenase (phytanoyl-CoA dioxygenase family)